MTDRVREIERVLAGLLQNAYFEVYQQKQCEIYD